MRQLQKKNNGITLVALVITIIILLILAGITIAQLTGSGLFENARLAEEKYKNAQEKEDETLADYENKIGEYINGNVNSNGNDLSEETDNPYKSNLLEYLSFDEKLGCFIQDINNTLTYEQKDGQSGNQCGYFTANNNYNRLITTNETLNFGTNDFTIELWAFYEEQTTSYTAFVIDNSNSNLSFLIKDGAAENNIGITVGASQTRINTGVSHKETINQWTHYALVRKDGVFYIYQNGIKIGEGTGYETTNIDLSNLTIGGSPDR